VRETVSQASDVGTLVTSEGVADHLGLPQSWVEAKTRQNLIPHRRFGRWIRYDLSEVRAWADKQHRGPSPR
jgi:hypothetical protein